MKEISIIGSGLNEICRLCLSSDVALSDIFYFSSKMKNSLPGFIMKCTAVQITRGDKLPNFICQLCHTKLEETHQFLTQIEQSDKTLRRYLKLLSVPDKPIKAECSVQPSDDNLIICTNDDIVKSEPLELDDVFDMDLNLNETGPGNFIQENYKNEKIYFKSENDAGLVDDYLFLPSECATSAQDIVSTNIDDKEFICQDSKIDIEETKVGEDMRVNWKEQKPENYQATNELMKEISLNIKINDVNMDDNVLILTKSVCDKESASSNAGINEFSCEDTKINIGDALENSCLHSANQTEKFNKREETNKNCSINCKKHKEANEFKSSNCDISNSYLSDRSSFHYHKRTHSGEKPYKCNVCIKCFTTAAKLTYHQRIHTGEKPYQCDLCTKCFSDSSNLKRHKLTHTGEKPYQCDLCTKCFSYSSNLNDHKRVHSGEKPYQCDVCTKCFFYLSSLNAHKRTHTGHKPYQCDLCTKCFTDSSNLNEHKRIHTDGKPYQCDVCNKFFSYSSNLKKHKRIHTGKKPYQCDLCTKYFFSSSNLNEHKRVHSGEKPYQCDLCTKCFSHSSSLTEHKRIHTGEKPYQCDLCNMSFSQSRSLKKHKRIHTGEKPYQCNLCTKCFSSSSNLNEHKRIHTGEKPYQCDFCNMSFSRSNSLKKHKCIHPGKKPCQ